MEMHAVEHSSNIHGIGYDPASQKLRIRFNGGAIYEYDNVPPDLFDQLMSAKSKGGFVHANIKGKFATTRVDTPKSAA